MSEDKSIRLTKVAKELNVGFTTLTEFLAKKGFQIEKNPNAKITDEMHTVLLKEYQTDKLIKEESEKISTYKVRKEDEEEEIPVGRKKSDFYQEEILIKNVAAFNPPIIHRQEPVVKPVEVKAAVEIIEEVKVPEIKEVVVPIVEIPVEPIAVIPEPKPEIIEKAPEVIEIVESPIEEKVIESISPSLKIVGKINLDELNSKTRPDKKTREQRLQEEAEQKANQALENAKKEIVRLKEEVKAQVEPVVTAKVEEVIIPEIKGTEITPEIKADVIEIAELKDETIRAKAEQLTGPKIIGKIELPEARKKQPVATSYAQQNELARKKRKRKENPPNAPGNAPNSGTPGTPNPNPNPRPAQTGGGNTFNRPAPRPAFGNKPTLAPRGVKAEPTEKEIQDQIKTTLARLSGAGKSGKFASRAKHRKQKRDDFAQGAEDALQEAEAQSKTIKATEFVTVNELSKLMDVSVTQIISTCMSLGMFVSINQRLDAETLSIVAEEFGYKVEFISLDLQENIEEHVDTEEELIDRAPIVTVMGHVDHGKTSLLDYVRKANVISGEAGGITQHIGAYEVILDNGKKIAFLDTPGHEAFTAMRARGAKVTDIVIVVIAADDSVMPQTVEAINHAQAAGVPIVFAFNKIDKPGANADKVREQLSVMNILVEEWGGKYQTQEISAKTGLNIELLLEKVLLEAELLELKANPDKRAIGTVIESALDKGRGIVTTVLVQSGTLKVGDPILAGCYSGRVKALFNERGQKVNQVGPSSPVLVLGMQGSPQAGDKFTGMESEVEAREISTKRLQLQREQGIRTQKHITLDEIGRRLAIGNFKELNIIVKGDVDGSIEALADSLLKLSTTEIQINVLHKSVGQITESDVLLASASDAIIIGFQVRPSLNARKLAEQEQIDIRLYSIIYDAINEIKSAMEGMLSPVYEEKIVANVEIREVFKITKVGTIAGCMVLDGKITRNSKVRVVRDGVVIHTGELASLKRFKDDVKEVATGYECGLNIEKFNDIKEGDIVEAYEQVEVKRKL